MQFRAQKICALCCIERKSEMINIDKVELNRELTLEQLMAVARFGAEVSFSEEYIKRVETARKTVEDKVKNNEVVYGTTTGFGSLSNRFVPQEDAEKLQRNIVITHSVSVGEPLEEEAVRAIMLIALESYGAGVSGVRTETCMQYRDMLNRRVTPFVPKHGSVGYLTLEAHIACAAIGEGKAYFEEELLPAGEALKKAGLAPITLSYKEGLSLTNGNISVTALSGLALFDLVNCARTADAVGAVSFEALHGLTSAYDERIMKVRGQREQSVTAENLLDLLEGSDICAASIGTHVQDALSLRCIPQAHGAAKRVINDARRTIETELMGCGDNPIFMEDGTALSNGNPDGGFEGLAMDSCCMAAAYLAKMSERRNNRFIDENLSGYPAYLVKEPGLNSGLMIPQYSQAGILNEMRMLAVPATIDGVPTSANQEDYVSMAFNACQKARKSAELLEYVLAIELFSDFQAQQFIPSEMKRGKGTGAILELLGKHVRVMDEDYYLHPDIEKVRDLIHSGEVTEAAEKAAGIIKMI